jgi:hypothetical protein
MTNDQERYALPGSPPTDEDLRHEVELTRQELGGTLARIMYKVDVPARTRDVLHTKLDQARDTARRYPAVVGGTIAGLSVLIALWLSLRR